MPKVVLTDRFVEDASAIWSDRVLSHLFRVVESLETFPLMGSPDVPDSIIREFGEDVRKCVIAPFDLVYEYREKDDKVMVYGLVPCAHAY